MINDEAKAQFERVVGLMSEPSPPGKYSGVLLIDTVLRVTGVVGSTEIDTDINVNVIAFAWPEEDGGCTVEPLAILIDEDMMNRLQNPVEEEEAP